MTRTFLLIFLSIVSLAFLDAQKMDTATIIGKWTNVDTASKTILSFHFDNKSNASINYGDKSISLKYSLDTEDSKQILVFATPDNKTIKYIVRFRSSDVLELFISKFVDFNINIRAWGMNEFLLLKRD